MATGNSEYRVFLACIAGDPARIHFRELSNAADHHAESGLVSRGPTPGHPTSFTVRARGSACEIEWKHESPSPLPDGARKARLEHGESFVATGHTYLIYREAEGRTWGSAPLATDYDEQSMAAIEALASQERRDALMRFCRLPYVARVLYDEFVARTAFKQYRDGRVPGVREVDWNKHGAIARLRADMAVVDMIFDQWSAPRLVIEWPLGRAEIDAIAECGELLRAIPA